MEVEEFEEDSPYAFLLLTSLDERKRKRKRYSQMTMAEVPSPQKRQRTSFAHSRAERSRKKSEVSSSTHQQSSSKEKMKGLAQSPKYHPTLPQPPSISLIKTKRSTHDIHQLHIIVVSPKGTAKQRLTGFAT